MADKVPLSDKTILKTAEEFASQTTEEEQTPSKQFFPYVIIADGPRQGSRFKLREGENPIGRSVSGVVMLEDQSVSRQHAVLIRSREGWQVKDVGSKNGTFVNGRKIGEPVTIGHGDIVQVGIYSLRLITKASKPEEELAPLPTEIEGKTMMVGSSALSGEGGETKTMVGSETGKHELSHLEETAANIDEELAEEEAAAAISEPQALPEKGRSPFVTHGIMAAALVALLAAGIFAYYQFFVKKAPPPPLQPTEPLAMGVSEPQVTRPRTIPIFLDFASSPILARVVMEGKEIGLTPVKINQELEIGKTYTAEATFSLDELQDTRTVKTSFTVAQDLNVIPILFKGKIGIIKVVSLPRESQLYFEGYYIDDPYKAHTAKLTEVVFGKPIYVPFGKYVIELRQPKQVSETNQFMEDIRFRREINITEDNPLYEISVTEEDLNKFPVEIRSVPDRADVLVDGSLVGQTPYKGTFPLGEHALTIRKDGYFEYTQDLKMDINTPYQSEITLKTTLAGEYLNAAIGFLNKNLYKDAAAQLLEVFKNSPTAGETAHAQYLLGTAYLRVGDLATATGYFEQARQDNNFKYPAMLGLVSVYGTQKDLGKALPLLVEVMLKNEDENVKKDASSLFQQISPMRSVIYIYTEPDGALVTVNDKPIEQKTPCILHDLGLGNYKIRIQKAGFVQQDLNINLSVSEFNPVIIKLKPIEE